MLKNTNLNGGDIVQAKAHVRDPLLYAKALRGEQSTAHAKDPPSINSSVEEYQSEWR